jgi:spoIIIJ-associated protein
VEWVKTTAKTLPEAIDLALDNLGVDESEAEINVLEEPKTGLFGRTRGIARVEARVKPKQSRPKADRNRNRNRRNDGDSSRGRNRKSGNKSGGNRGGQSAGTRDGRSDRAASGSRDGDAAGTVATAERGGDAAANKAESQDRTESGRNRGQGRSGGSADNGNDGRSGGGRSRSRNRRRSNNGSGGGGQEASAKAGKVSESSDDKKADNRSKSSSGSNKDREAAVPSQDASVEEVSAHLEGFLTDLTVAFGYDADVVLDTSDGDDIVVGRIDEPIGYLVGPKGRTLEAVQELARISCQRTVPSNVRIKVDVGGYRQKRADKLAEFARSAADRAVDDGVEVALEPMSAADRKAVHDALNADDRVTTRSVGVDPRRRILVVPVEADDDDSELGDEEE